MWTISSLKPLELGKPNCYKINGLGKLLDIKFGTDGWRGIIADDFTFANVRRCAQAVCRHIQAKGIINPKIFVGYDTRFLSEDFSKAVAEVICGNNIKCLLSSTPVPTPVVSHNVLSNKADGGIVITASHNPPQWNGFKYKPEYAGSASPEIVSDIEYHLSQISSIDSVNSIPFKKAIAQGICEVVDATSTYNAHLRTMVDIESIRSSGINIIIDPMYGAGAGYLSSLLSGSSIGLQEIHGSRNPIFPGMSQPEPVKHNLNELSDAVLKHKANVGLALDADADRFGLIDNNGQFVTPLEVFALLALYFLDNKRERGTIVKSRTTTNMIYTLGKLYGVPIVETPVGFKYIGPMMMQENALMGGEESGGFAFRGHIPERDGILSALFVLEMINKTGRTIPELLEKLFDLVGPHYYKRTDVSFSNEERADLEKRLDAISIDTLAGATISQKDDIDGTRFILTDGSWAIIRFSGTEPLMRIYAESQSEESVDKLISECRNLMGV